MARKRMIDPEFWLDEGMAELSMEARLLFIGLWGICDDNYATFPNREKWIKAQVFPYDDVDIRRLLDELSASTRIVLFEAEDKEQYYYIKNFFKYQKVDRPSAPKYPQFDENQAILVEPSTSPRPEVKLSKVKLSKEKRVETLTHPTNEEIQSIAERYQVPIPFVLSKWEDVLNYEARIGKPYKDKLAALRNFVKQDAIKIKKEVQSHVRPTFDATGLSK